MKQTEKMGVAEKTFSGPISSPCFFFFRMFAQLLSQAALGQMSILWTGNPTARRELSM